MSAIPSRCAWCGAKSAEMFDKRCYAVIDGETKGSMRALIRIGEPQRARRLGLNCLAALCASGVPMPERRSDHAERGEGVAA